MGQDVKSSRAKHSLRASQVRYPPVRRIARIPLFNEMQAWKLSAVEDLRFSERVIVLKPFYIRAAAHERLENQHICSGPVVNQIQSQQRITKMIEDTHKQDDIEALVKCAQIVNRQLTELYIHPAYLG